LSVGGLLVNIPSPSLQSGHAVHSHDAICKETRERAGQSAGGKEYSDSGLTFVRQVPFADCEDGAWEESCSVARLSMSVNVYSRMRLTRTDPGRLESHRGQQSSPRTQCTSR